MDSDRKMEGLQLKIFFTPIVGDIKVDYKFNRQTITVTIDGGMDVFDFSSLPDGEMDSIETSLPYKVIVRAEKVEGVLYVEILNFISEDATEFERFPNWIEVGEE